MKLKIFNQNIAEVNSYLLVKKKEIIVIDPGFNGDSIINFCKENEANIRYVFLTHGHFDHIKSLEKLAKAYTFQVIINEADINLLKNDELNYARSFGQSFVFPTNLELIPIKDGFKKHYLDEDFWFISTPGHTKGSQCIGYNDWLFTGDTLFFDSVGRTDLATGSPKDLNRSIEQLKKTISNKMIIYPGHGGHSDMKTIKENNRFLR